MGKNVVVLMVRYPEPRAISRELSAALGTKDASLLKWAVIQDMVANAAGESGYDLAISFEPKGREREFKRLAKFKKAVFRSQGRSQDSIMECVSQFLKEYERVVIVVSDVLALSKSTLRKAFSILRSRDIVLGKSEDGSFYLVGMHEQQDIFDSIEWGSDTMLQQAIKNITAHGLSYALLPPAFKAETMKDIHHLRKKGGKAGCPRTFAILAKLHKKLLKSKMAG